MNFEVLDEIVARNSMVNICPICGTPFRKFHSRQKTCGAEECKRLWRCRYYERRRKKKLAEDPEAFREYRREAEKKTREKKKEKEMMRKNYGKMQSYWERQLDKELKIRDAEDGNSYGKKQVEKTLAQVPKIDVSGFERKTNNE